VTKAITKEERALLKEASEMFVETGCVPGIDGEQVPAESLVPDAKDAPGFTLVLSWLAQKWHQRCLKLASGARYLTKEQQQARNETA
jgi:hypothetical protein